GSLVSGAGSGLGGEVANGEERQQDVAEKKPGPRVVGAGQLGPAQCPVERWENANVPCAEGDDGQPGRNIGHSRMLPVQPAATPRRSRIERSGRRTVRTSTRCAFRPTSSSSTRR